MNSPRTVRERLVRDYSEEDGFNDRRLHSAPYRDRWDSPPSHAPLQASIRPESRDEQDEFRKLDFNPESAAEHSTYEASVSTQPTSISGNHSSRLADFFGPEVYQIALHNPTIAYQLKKFAQARLCGENLDFLEKVRIKLSWSAVTDVGRLINTSDL